MNIVFMGTPDFAVASLRAIHAQFPVKAVVTVPDKPKGRGLEVQPSAVKKAALELGITTILQPESLNDAAFQEELKVLNPDIIAVVAFRILPREVYTAARLGAFNIHGSLLPKYRGAAPIHWAIMSGETESGVTSFLLADGVDTGAMLGRRTTPITDGMTTGELHDVLMLLGAELALETCQMLASGTAKPLPQNDSEATKAPKLFRENCHIDWNKSARAVRNQIHGLSPHPGAWTTLPDGKTLKIIRCSLADHEGAANLKVGEYRIESGEWLVGCLQGAVQLGEIQPEGKRVMAASEFLRGFRGDIHGEFQ
ncbi:MAG: methionyl-tRNA formyltransferase [Candidatus Kapabacteria bacterium]|jgi:methionyl-tRNA formyltransferase|nr:methionyl-tRNA formyltransferase [Candidatus Kapabacteria bacterium]